MGICVARCDGKVEGRNRRGHIERNFVLAREDRDSVGADLVRRIAICGDAVGADDHRSNPAGLQKMARPCCR